MTDPSSSSPSIAPPVRPSRADQLKRVAAGPVATFTAMVIALTGLVTAVTTLRGTKETARTSYETLRDASQTNALRIDICYTGQLEQRAWIQELTERFEKRQANLEEAVARKKPTVVPPVEPVPAAPPTPVVPEPAKLPPFDSLPAKP